MASLVRRDRNHAAIRAALVAAGRPVKDVSGYSGLGCDLLTEHLDGRMLALEVKDGTKVASARKLTVSEEQLRAMFPGAFVVVLSVEDALRACGLLRSEAR